jgi:hypothetical protein
MATKNYGLVGLGGNVELSKGGARIKNVAGVVEARNNADSAYAVVRGDHPIGLNDFVTLQYLKTKGDVVVIGQIHGGAPPAAGSAGRVYVCTTTGGGYTINHLYFDNGVSWEDVGPAEGQTMAVTDALTGGAVEFLADTTYIWNLDATVWVNIGPSTITESKHVLKRSADIAYTDTGVVNIGAAVSGNGRVSGVWINVTQIFNGLAPTLTVGDAGDADRFVATTEVDLKTVGLYKMDASHLFSISTQVYATVVPDSSTTGAANITLYYAEA